MPYADPESKRLHNEMYHEANKVRLLIARIVKREQKKITQKVYDQIKHQADPEWLSTLTVTTKPAPVQPPTEEKIVKRTPKVSIESAKQLVEKLDIANSSKKTYKSKVNVLTQLLCPDTNDFVCIYKSLKNNIDTIVKTYKNANGYLKFMHTMMTQFDEIKSHVSKRDQELLNSRLSDETVRQEGITVQTSEDRDRTTDWDEEYAKMSQSNEQLNDELVMIQTIYINGVYNHEGELAMIPRNYFSNVMVVNNKGEVVDNNQNYYVKSTGTFVINDYKTSKTHGAITHRVTKDVRAKINAFVKGRQYLFGNGDASNLNRKIKQALGVGVDQYRRIMKRKHEVQYNATQIAKAMGHRPVTGKVSY